MEIVMNQKRNKYLDTKDFGQINSISHNLRTPLTCLLGFAQLLKATKLTKKQKKYLGNLQLSACQLAVNIEDLLMLLNQQEKGVIKKYEQKI